MIGPVGLLCIIVQHGRNLKHIGYLDIAYRFPPKQRNFVLQQNALNYLTVSSSEKKKKQRSDRKKVSSPLERWQKDGGNLFLLKQHEVKDSIRYSIELVRNDDTCPKF